MNENAIEKQVVDSAKHPRETLVKLRTSFLFPALLVTALFACVGTAFAQSELLVFDDLSGLMDPVPYGYGGLQWSNLSSYNTVYYSSLDGSNGLNNGAVSLNNVVFNAGGAPASMAISGGKFNLNSAYLVGVWNDGLQVEVQGFVGAVMAYDQTFTVGTQDATLINFNYAGVDKVNFISSGGVPHGFSGGAGSLFGMDNLSVTLSLDPGKVQDFTYTTNAGQITITGYNGPGGNVTIPSSIDGLPVTSIGDSAFWANGSLNNVVIGDGVLTIGLQAFRYCTNLISVSIPASMLSIAMSTFNTGDTKAFDNCASLTAINVDPQNSVYSSVDGVLFNKDRSEILLCPGGKRGNYVIPNNVVVVGDGAFSDCSNLANVTIAESVTELKYHAFDNCVSLTNITVPNSVTNMQDARGGCFGACVDGGVFGGCISLTNVIVGKGLTYLGLGAFTGCTNLLSVYFKGNAPSVGYTVVGYENIFGLDSTTVYYLPSTTGWGSTLAGRPAVLWNPQIQTSDASFGVRPNGFGFNITGMPNIPIVIEGFTNFGAGPGVSLQSCTLTNGSIYFGDPQWTNYPGRVYRIRSP